MQPLDGIENPKYGQDEEDNDNSNEFAGLLDRTSSASQSKVADLQEQLDHIIRPDETLGARFRKYTVLMLSFFLVFLVNKSWSSLMDNDPAIVRNASIKDSPVSHRSKDEEFELLESQAYNHPDEVTMDNAEQQSKQKIKRIAILGERNSGAPWVATMIKHCFSDIEVTPYLSRMSHWFQDPTYNPPKEPTLVISIFLNIYNWVDLMCQNPLYAPYHEKMSWETFVTSPWTMPRPQKDLAVIDNYSNICQFGFKYSQVIPCAEEEHFQTPVYELDVNGIGSPYHSILELRSDKIKNFLSTHNWDNVQSFISVKYENLLKDTGFQSLLQQIQMLSGNNQLTCDLLDNAIISTQDGHLYSAVAPFNIGHQDPTNGFIDWIDDNADWEAEFMIGYGMGDLLHANPVKETSTDNIDVIDPDDHMEAVSDSTPDDADEYSPSDNEEALDSETTTSNPKQPNTYPEQPDMEAVSDSTPDDVDEYSPSDNEEALDSETTTSNPKQPNTYPEQPDDLFQDEAKSVLNFTSSDIKNDDKETTFPNSEQYYNSTVNYDAHSPSDNEETPESDTTDMSDHLYVDDFVTKDIPQDDEFVTTYKAPETFISDWGMTDSSAEAYEENSESEIGSTVDVNQIVVLAERNSGQAWLIQNLQKCFPEIKISKSLSRPSPWFQDLSQAPSIPSLVIALFMNPYAWVHLMNRNPLYSPDHTNLDWFEFVTKPWTMERPREDELLKAKTGRVCQMKFTFSEVVPCAPIGSFLYDDPLYENNNSAIGEPYKSIVDLRADKIQNFLSTKDWPDVLSFIYVQYESLVKKTGFASLILKISSETSLVPECDIFDSKNEFVAPSLKFNMRSDEEYFQWMNSMVHWDVEKLIDYHMES